MARIVIDPGHGGAATIPGDSTWNNAVGPGGTLEKTLTLDVGLRVLQQLKDKGHRVEATRTTDVNLRLRDRAAVAKRLKADVFVSIHFNGSTGHNAQGTETLVELNHTSQSARLSLCLQDALLQVTGHQDRNSTFNPTTRIKPQALGVLRLARHHPETAACLAEVSFLDRAEEEARLQSPAYRSAIATGIVAGIETYLSALVRRPGQDDRFGDAIEGVAGSASPTRVLQFLDLASKGRVQSRGNDGGEGGERIAPPKPLFPASFLRGRGDHPALARSLATWPDAGDFTAFITSLGLQHFQPDEFLELGASHQSGKCKGLNTFPPRALWPRIANTAQMLDRIRDRLGAAIRITSCYRSPAYNTCVGGETNSLHMQFNAVDFTAQSGTPEVWRRIAASVRAEEARF
ncbi:MAG: N-acetylmuramoyl-L-alanine amidase [Tabrizicola sp.]